MEELEKNETSTQAEENTVSLASAQALADALAKIEAYTPTTWVDNSSPDIDAEHLNKPEQAIKRVTDALNSAVDVIKDLQSQVTKNAGDISTVNNNLSKCLQYIHSETDVFDFNDPKTPAGYHRLGAAASYKNAPSGLDGVNFCTVEVVRPTISDTLAMTIYPYKKGINPPVWYKSGGSNEWPTLPWNVYATKSDLSAIGSYKLIAPKETSLVSGKWTACANLTLPKGRWLVFGKGDFLKNGTGDRSISFNDEGKETQNRYGFATITAPSSVDAGINLMYFLSLQSEKVITLRAYQNSGANLNIYPSIEAIGLG